MQAASLSSAATNKLLELIRPELRVELRTALYRAVKSGSSVEASHVPLVLNGVSHVVIMTVRPVVDETPPGMMLIVFNEVQESLTAALADSQGRDAVSEVLEAELLQLQLRLKNTVGESTAFTEELRASNEELQTINEELRSTTEELETSREELQSVNEELTTVNNELIVRVEDSTQLNDDLHNLMNSAEISTVFVDRDMKLKRFTPQAATLFNLLGTDIGRPLMDITHRLEFPELSRDVRDVLRNLTRSEREVRSQDNRWFLARIVPYRTTENRIEGAVLAFFDITLRRMAEDNLRLSEQRMRLVAESMRDYAIITMDEAGVIVTWSPGAEKIFGYSPKEAIGQPFGLIFQEEHRLAALPEQELAKARELGRADDDQWHLRKNGDTVYCSGITVPLEGSGVEGFAKICRNFTREELRERQREMALQTERTTRNQLQETSTKKDEFLAVVSHELKNPLSVIKMNAQLLSRMPGLQGNERGLRAIASIDAAIASQLQIINDLLEFSRANMGKLVLAMSYCDLAEIVINVADAMGHDITQKSQTLRVKTVPAVVYADPVRVEQIVWNLMTNAVKFTSIGGLIEIDLSISESTVCLSVKDSGIGLEPAHLQDVFEMFRQVDTGLNRRTGGLGIGLALVKQLAELHGGRVAAASAGVGEGACFNVWLPLKAVSVDERTASFPLSDAFENLRVLVVDNEPQLLQAFGALLESEGAQVTLCASAQDAVDVAARERFDAVISDLAMPERDGHWLAQQLRAQAATHDLALIAVSGMTRDIDRLEAQAAGFDAHLDKPVDMKLLEENLSMLMQRPRKIASKIHLA
ncbi:PAS domain-containing protein [Variovorax sp. PvP013]|uniref:PAS domain-containing protein n=1 Tax=Variovorax sp. PvP013 TaxID=3156435 RepID=UPI003D244333